MPERNVITPLHGVGMEHDVEVKHQVKPSPEHCIG